MVYFNVTPGISEKPQSEFPVSQSIFKTGTSLIQVSPLQQSGWISKGKVVPLLNLAPRHEDILE
jgi:hypothetical protein